MFQSFAHHFSSLSPLWAGSVCVPCLPLCPDREVLWCETSTRNTQYTWRLGMFLKGKGSYSRSQEGSWTDINDSPLYRLLCLGCGLSLKVHMWRLESKVMVWESQDLVRGSYTSWGHCPLEGIKVILMRPLGGSYKSWAGSHPVCFPSSGMSCACILAISSTMMGFSQERAELVQASCA